MNKPHSFFQIVLRGMAMGAADVVPGVSGGTMALITGIYERLITAIGAISADAWPALKKEGFNARGVRAAWQAIDGTFLLAVGIGIIASVLTVARGLTWALENYPPVVWAFFIGLIAASSFIVLRAVKQWNMYRVALVVVFAAVLVLISALTPATTTTAPWFIVVSGMIAISAMILPGISGSFILVLLGKYEYILNAVHELNITVLALFCIGCALGLLTSSRIISWLFKRFHDSTMAAIFGIMIGSLYAVWPWRQVTRFSGEYGTEEFAVLTDQPVLPAQFAAESVIGIASPANAYVLASIIACIVGIVIVFAIDRLSGPKPETNA